MATLVRFIGAMVFFSTPGMIILSLGDKDLPMVGASLTGGTVLCLAAQAVLVRIEYKQWGL